jgi:hypothetical protein
LKTFFFLLDLFLSDEKGTFWKIDASVMKDSGEKKTALALSIPPKELVCQKPAFIQSMDITTTRVCGC